MGSYDSSTGIAASAVARSCYINHSAMHRKRQISTPEGAKTPKPIVMQLGMVDYVRDPHHMTTLVGITLRGWSGHICDLSNLGVSFLSFSFFLFLLSLPRAVAHRSHFLTDRDDLYVKTCVSSQGCAFWVSRQYLTTFRGSNPKKPPQTWPE